MGVQWCEEPNTMVYNEMQVLLSTTLTPSRNNIAHKLIYVSCLICTCRLRRCWYVKDLWRNPFSVNHRCLELLESVHATWKWSWHKAKWFGVAGCLTYVTLIHVTEFGTQTVIFWQHSFVPELHNWGSVNREVSNRTEKLATIRDVSSTRKICTMGLSCRASTRSCHLIRGIFMICDHRFDHDLYSHLTCFLRNNHNNRRGCRTWRFNELNDRTSYPVVVCFAW